MPQMWTLRLTSIHLFSRYRYTGDDVEPDTDKLTIPVLLQSTIQTALEVCCENFCENFQRIRY